jgi:hypothetical protein
MVTVVFAPQPDLPASVLGDLEIAQVAVGMRAWLNAPRSKGSNGPEQGPAGAYSQGAYAVSVVPRGKPAPVGDTHTWLVELHALSDAGAGVLGYHAVRNGNTPYAKIFVESCLQVGQPWTIAATHEVVEMMVNRLGTDLVLQGMPDGTQRGNMREACDPVEAGVYAKWFSFSKTLPPIAVTNFVLPSYWAEGSPGPWDDRSILKAALTPDQWGRQTFFTITGTEQTAARVHLASQEPQIAKR